MLLSGPSRTPVPTGKNSNRIDTPNARFFSAQGIRKLVRRPQRLRRCPYGVRLRFAPLRVTQKTIIRAQTRRGDSRIDEIGNDPATLFRSISLKPCRGRRPRRPGNERIFNLQPAMIGSRIKSKICCFPDRRGRRSLQAKIQTASTHRTRVFSPRRGYGNSLGDPNACGVAPTGFDYASLRSG